eukprot:g27915.t1
MRRCRSELQALFKEPPEAPLLLYVDASMAQLPLEACPSLRHRNVVRGLAPNITLAALSSSEPTSTTGFFVIDPAEDCAAMVDAWHGHTGRLPEPARVLEELCKKDIFVYLGHGEKARHLLRQETLQEKNSPACQAGLRSILMLLGCSSVKIQNASTFSQDESFGLVSSALLGGAPLVLGAQWDVLGGDLDKLASRLLQRWLKEGKPTRCGGLLAALKTLRPNCLLPNLTGAALVCYGIPSDNVCARAYFAMEFGSEEDAFFARHEQMPPEERRLRADRVQFFRKAEKNLKKFNPLSADFATQTLQFLKQQFGNIRFMLRELTIPLTDDFNDGVLHANAALRLANIYLWAVVPVKVQFLRLDELMPVSPRREELFQRVWQDEHDMLQELRSSARDFRKSRGRFSPHSLCQSGWWKASALSDCSDQLLTALRQWTDALPAHQEGLGNEKD